MTGREFSEVDIDLLADYVCGALDGTPDETVVSALVSDDPAWREAHDSLVVGMESVGADLHALGAEPVTMPDDVAARLTAALSALGPAADPENLGLREPAPDDATDGTAPAAAGRHLSSVPATGGASTTVARRRMRRWAAPIAAAAGIIAFAGAGINYLTDPSRETPTSTAAGGRDAREAPMTDSAVPGAGRAVGDPEVAGRGGLNAPPAADQIVISGVDYDLASLSGAARASVLSTSENASLPQAEKGSAGAQQAPAPVGGKVIAPDSTTPALQRLTDREALLACLEAIARVNGGGPISVSTVDYARYGGAPALIVRFTAGNGEWAFAVGPDCGAPGAGAATLQPVQVS